MAGDEDRGAEHQGRSAAGARAGRAPGQVAAAVHAVEHGLVAREQHAADPRRWRRTPRRRRPSSASRACPCRRASATKPRAVVPTNRRPAPSTTGRRLHGASSARVGPAHRPARDVAGAHASVRLARDHERAADGRRSRHLRLAGERPDAPVRRPHPARRSRHPPPATRSRSTTARQGARDAARHLPARGAGPRVDPPDGAVGLAHDQEVGSGGQRAGAVCPPSSGAPSVRRSAWTAPPLTK